MKVRSLLLVLALVVAGACGGDGDDETGDSVTGIVTSVESSGLNEVTSFTLKTEDDTEYEILIDPDLNYGFPLGHLEEHRVSADPVEVTFQERDGKVYASSIADV